MLKLDDVHVSFKQGSQHIHVLQGVSLECEPNNIITFVGKSGSGKSTLLKVIAGMLEVDAGDLQIYDKNITQLSAEARRQYCHHYISFVWQDFKLIDEMSLKDNILLPLYIQHKKVDETYFKQLVETLEIDQLLNKFPHQLSGGEKQRGAIARALIVKPDILLADEPTGALDNQTAQNIIELFQTSLQQFVKLIIIVTHDLVLADIGTFKYQLCQGKVVML